MFHRILVAYDGSEGADAALRVGIDLAKSLAAELRSISVEEHLPRYAASISEVEGAKEQIDEHFRVLTKQARDVAGLDGIDLDTVVRQGHEVEEIVGFAREEGFDLVILGSHGHSRIPGLLLGSTALSVARAAPCSALIVRRQGREGAPSFRRILVGIDGSPLGRLAFRTALDLAILNRATLLGATVLEASPLALAGERDTYARQLKAGAEEHARAAGVPFEHVARRGHAAHVLAEVAREVEADLIVLGATGLEHPWSATIGGTAGRVIGEADRSTLLVRPIQATLRVGQVMAKAVSTVTPVTPLADVVELLLRRDVKAVPVVDGQRRVVGIITGGDLLSRGDLDLRLSIKRELEAETLRERLRALGRSKKLARDVMSTHVHTITAGHDLLAAIHLMARHGVKRLPVVDEKGALAGIVSRADVLRAIAALPPTPQPIERVLPGVARTIGEAATVDVPVVHPDAPAEAVLAKVLESPLRRVVVTGPGDRVVGLISDRDLLARSFPTTRSWLLRALAAARPRRWRGERAAQPAPLTAAQLMTPSVITVRAEDSLVHAIRLMMQHRVKRLVVVDDAGRLRGLVDRRGILRLLAGEP
jgi:CBS-domain-containing membrane protein